MEIHLPNSAFLGNIDPFIRSYRPNNKKELKISFNDAWVSVHPVVLCMVASLGLYVSNGGGEIFCQKPTATSKHYLERMGLFQILELDSEIKIKSHESAGRFIPLTQIFNSQELYKFITEMIPLLHSEPSHVEPIKYVISELVRNVFEHSESEMGAIVCAQYHKKNNVIRIGVVDSGIGIRKSISYSYETEDDLHALQLALTPGITGKTRNIGGTETNAGAGLFFIKSIAKVNRDFFVIYSGNALYKLLKTLPGSPIKLNMNPFEDRSSRSNNFPYWQGTVVGIDISLNRHQTFDKLLELIRETYFKDIKERKKERFKKPKFI
ncbi:sensor histidine kinase [Candidatus Woesearchaeota archaeon]|nr:sensor histidine kinase [Candidatus Woesearchaeota archaeon]